MVWLLNSQGMKSCKSRESFCLSILAIYTNYWSTFWHVSWRHFIFSSVRFLNMCKPRTGWPTKIGIYGSGLASLPSCLEIVNTSWLRSIRSEIFLQMKFIFFQSCPIKQAIFLPGQPARYNQLLIQPILHFPECYFA